jgi:hypothetical protein
MKPNKKTESDECEVLAQKICDFVASKKDEATLKEVQKFVQTLRPDFDEFTSGLWIRGMCGTNGQYLIIWETTYHHAYITAAILDTPYKESTINDARVSRHWTHGGPPFKTWDFSRMPVYKRGVAPSMNEELDAVWTALDKGGES